MIDKFKILCRVKKLREDSLFRALQLKRRELKKAVLAVEKLTIDVQNSDETLPARINDVYNTIMLQVVDVDDIDETKTKVINLQEDHQRIVDRLERAIQIKIRLEKEMEEASTTYHVAQRNREKFDRIRTDLESEAAIAFEQKEESEIEELFTKGQLMPS